MRPRGGAGRVLLVPDDFRMEQRRLGRYSRILSHLTSSTRYSCHVVAGRFAL